MEQFWRDLKYGWNIMLRQRTAAVVALLTLGLGTGLTTAVLSLLNVILWSPLPYPRPEAIMRLWEDPSGAGHGRAPVSPPNFIYWQSRNNCFQGIAAYTMTSFSMVGGPQTAHVKAAAVSPNIFSVMQVQPALGRTFLSEETIRGGPKATILSYSLWQRLYGGNTNILGQTIRLDGESYIIVGTMRRGFAYPDSAELWVPLVFTPEQLSERGSQELEVVARLKEGVSIQVAKNDMFRVADELRPLNPPPKKNWGVVILPLYDLLVGHVAKLLWIFAACAFAVLIIACGNVANLLLAQGAVRERELALRSAVGASRGRLIAQLLAENLWLGGLGTLLGTFVAVFLLKVFGSSFTLSLPRFDADEYKMLDLRLLGVCLLLSLFVTFAAGLLPAFQISNFNLYNSLKDGSKGSTSGNRRHVMRFLVIGQLTLSFILTVSAAAFVQGYRHLASVDPGFSPDHVLTTQITLPEKKYDAPQPQKILVNDLLLRLHSIPEVKAAGVIQTLPLRGEADARDFLFPDEPGAARFAGFDSVTPQTFEILQIPLKMGRLFTEADNESASKVMIVNEAFVRSYIPKGNPVGKRIQFFRRTQWEIVGVVGDVKGQSLERPAQPHFYVPFTQKPSGYPYSLSVILKTSTHAEGVAQKLVEAVQASDRDLVPFQTASMDQVISSSIGRRSVSMKLVGTFSVVALFLSAVGLYGLLSQIVAQRKREIGIRMALGCTRRQIIHLIIKYSLTLVGIGIIFGFIGSWGSSRLIASQIYGAGQFDASLYFTVASVLAGVGLITSFVPAYIAAGLNPYIVLREE